MLLELGLYRFRYTALCPISGDLIFLARCCKPTDFINLDIMWRRMRWNSPEVGCERQKLLCLSKPHPVSKAVVSCRKVSLPAGLDLHSQWSGKIVPAGIAVNALQILENQWVLESCISLRMQDLGNPTSLIVGLPSGIPGLSFHLLCVTSKKTFLWERFLNKAVASMKCQRWQSSLQVAELLCLCWLVFVGRAAMTGNDSKVKPGVWKLLWWLQCGGLP